MTDIARERKNLRAQIATALEDDEDPLAAYENFVKWTLKHYPTGDPNSGLVDLLEEATKKFKDDVGYKGDLRYLKLWSMYARHVKEPAKVYEFLVANGIGIAYSLLYEEYANTLEQDGRHSEADTVYLMGIKRQVRPLERLKKRHREFQSRRPSSSTTSTTASTTPVPSSLSGSPHSRYLPMLAPPAPGRRPEKLRFNLGLLFTADGVEYSAAEVRARAIGLLGKKWGPPPATVRVNFNDSARQLTGRKSVAMAEPTVTINTKEALADVFGMYNSPEKTMRVAPGSKHAPVRKIAIEPVTPVVRQQVPPTVNEESAVLKTPAFRPFVDDNAMRKENTTPGPAKFKPFVDAEPISKESVTPGPAKFKPFVDAPEPAHKTPDARRALSVKDTKAPPTSIPRPKPLLNDPVLRLKPVPEDASANVFSKVFTPAPREPELQTGGAAFVPFVDQSAKTPFKVFSRPPAPTTTPRVGAFTPYVDEQTKEGPWPTPRAPLGLRTHVQHPEEVEAEESDNDQPPDRHEDEELESPTPIGTQDETYEEEEDEDASSPPQVPLGGRFGQFNVMTPITERTFEFTTSTRAPATPNDFHDHSGVLDKALLEQDAVEAAERLAAELKEEEEREAAFPDAQNEALRANEDYDDSFASFDEPAVPPFRLSDGHSICEDDRMTALEEKAGTLSLSDTLMLMSSFKPPNPCIPSDPTIVSTLLSLIPSEFDFYDLRAQEAKLLDGLQKFAQKRQRGSSGNTITSSSRGDTSWFPINIAGRRFNVSEKLGEGGFGAVFAAKDLSAKDTGDEDDEDFEEDEDEDASSMVALKIVKPRNLWEFHVLRRMRSKLPSHLRASVVFPHALYAFRDESFLVLDLSPQGTLLDVVNRATQAGVSQQGACLDELLVMFFTIELMRLVEGMHSAGFIHGDLKIDNCLLRLEDVPGGATAWSSVYQPSGVDGWASKGVRVIDFGRTIDTQLFPASQQFIADWPIDARDCVEMREGRPWTYQTDYFGLAGIIYCMLFGKYIESSAVVKESSEGVQRYKISTPFKRYWQNELWRRLFDLLLNPCLVRPDGQLPVSEELGVMREEMEVWLQANCNRTSNTLKGLLKKIERSVWDSR